MIIRRAQIKDANRISYLIRRNTALVKANGYNNSQIKAWSNQNKPKAIQENIRSKIIFCALF